MATLVSLPAALVPRAHTASSVLAFAAALFLGWASGLWEALCENAVAKWPVEWFPSVSATIGDHAATRDPFQILIALTATPRFVLLLLQWIVHRYPPQHRGNSTGPSSGAGPGAGAGSGAVKATGPVTRRRAAALDADGTTSDKGAADAHVEKGAGADVRRGPSAGLVDAEVMCGLARTFCCAGWMYITSRDQHDLHDLFMIVYIVLNVPWMVLSTLHSTDARARRWRQICGGGFGLFLFPLIYLFYKHSVLRVPGAYTQYAFFEWSLVAWDVAFDFGCVYELGHLQVRVVDTSRGDDEPWSGDHDHNHSGIFLYPTAPAPPRSEADWTALPSPPARVSRLPYRDVLAYVSDLWFAVAFWTIFTSVSVQLFYWSVWSLAITGSELAIFINLAPFALSRPNYRAYCTSHEGLLTNRAILFFVGLGCYAIPHNAARFLCAVAAMWCGWCAFLGDSVRLRGSVEMRSQAKIFTTGIVIAMLAKYNAYSNNPFWPLLDAKSGGWNKTGLFISALAFAEYYYRPNSLFPAPPHSATLKDKPTLLATTQAQRLSIAFGLGAFMHLLQTYASDAGTIIAWSWTGYPLTGPTLHPWSGVTICVASLALVLDLDMTSPAMLVFPWPCAALLLWCPDWLGYFGGLGLVFYAISLAPTMIRAASALPPKTWGQAMSWNCFLDVASVFTVAYAFVPFGWLLRERTDLMTLIILAPIPFALRATATLPLPSADLLQPRAARRVASVSRWTRYSAGAVAVLALISSTMFTARSAANVKPVPFYPEHRIFTGGIFTVHFGIDEPGRCSQRRIAQLVKEMEVDVLGMLETDLHRFVYGNRDLTRYIAEELGYYVDLGPGPNSHTWGACLLSKFPIVNSTHHLLPSPHGELAPAIHATLDVHGQRVDVLVSHNGQEEDPLDRELQTRELARLLGLTDDVPTVFLGYLITRQGDEPPSPYGILFSEQTGLIDIETLDNWRWCEYIGFRGLWRIAYGRIEHSDVTDTELQVGKFILPLPEEKVVYNDHAEKYWHVAEVDIPELWRLPAMFRGEGVRGHKYRIWDGPLYYYPPAHSKVRGYGWRANTAWPPT